MNPEIEDHISEEMEVGGHARLALLHLDVVMPEIDQVLHDVNVFIDAHGRVEISRRRPRRGEIHDLRGKYLMPGLIDLHTHAWWNWAPDGTVQDLGIDGSARAMLYAGVTTFLDLFSPEAKIFPLRDAQRAARGTETGDPMADIYAAGPLLTCTGGHGTEYGVPTRTIDTPEQAVAVIDDLATARPDVIKLAFDHGLFGSMPAMSRETLTAALAHARTRGIKTVVHVGNWDDAKTAAELGASAVTHLGIPRLSSRPDVIAALRANDVAVIPTSSVLAGELAFILDDPALLQNPLLRDLVPPAFLALFSAPVTVAPIHQHTLEIQRAAVVDGQNAYAQTLTDLATSQLRVLAGTDSGNVAVIQGYALHREIQQYRAAGFGAWPALRTATTDAAAFLGFDNRLCTAVRGIKLRRPCPPARGPLRANFIVLNASPVADIANTTDLADHLVYGGQWIDRATLRERFIAAPLVPFVESAIYR